MSPGIAMGNTSDSGDHSLGSYKNPQIRYDTSTVYTSGNQIGQNAPTLTLLSQQMEFRLTSDADLEAVRQTSGLSLYENGIKVQHVLTMSDSRIKTNIRETTGALDTFLVSQIAYIRLRGRKRGTGHGGFHCPRGARLCQEP